MASRGRFTDLRNQVMCETRVLFLCLTNVEAAIDGSLLVRTFLCPDSTMVCPFFIESKLLDIARALKGWLRWG